ncbi:MAG: hypothetical protein M3Q44_03605 [bacterium]|nr:hypothetical protein [bacterium]
MNITKICNLVVALAAAFVFSSASVQAAYRIPLITLDCTALPSGKGVEVENKTGQIVTLTMVGTRGYADFDVEVGGIFGQSSHHRYYANCSIAQIKSMNRTR